MGKIYEFFYELFVYFNQLVFYSFPVFVLGFFCTCLVRYLSAVNKNKKNPETFSVEEIKRRKHLFRTASIIALVCVAAIIGLIILTYGAIAYM